MRENIKINHITHYSTNNLQTRSPHIKLIILKGKYVTKFDNVKGNRTCLPN